MCEKNRGGDPAFQVNVRASASPKGRGVYSTKRCVEPFSSSGGWNVCEGEANEMTEELIGTSSWLIGVWMRIGLGKLSEFEEIEEASNKEILDGRMGALSREWASRTMAVFLYVYVGCFLFAA